MRRAWRSLAVASSIVVGSLAWGSVAGAAAPEIVRTDLTRHVDPFLPCDGFNIVGDFEITRTLMTFFDAAGDVVRTERHRAITGTLTNSVTQETFPFREHDASIFYPDESAQTTGEELHIVLPGEGTLVLIAGIEEVDVDGELTFSGRFGPGGEEAICAALSGNA